MPVYTPVADYNFDSDESEDDFDDGVDFDDDLAACFGDSMPMSPLGASRRPRDRPRLKGRMNHLFSFAAGTAKSRKNWEMIPSAEDLARAELDGNRPHSQHPMTIIQVKNPEKNVDSNDFILNNDVNGSFSFIDNMAATLVSMSAAKKFCLAIGVVAALTLAAAFLFKMPCSNLSDLSCDSSSNSGLSGPSSPSGPAGAQVAASTTGLDWSRVFNQLALVSGLEVVPLFSFNRRHIVVSGFESAPGNPRGAFAPDSAGLIAIDPTNGEEVWRRPLFASPTAHDCNLVDTDGDGITECIVVGHNGLMASVEVVQGVQLWSLHHHIPLVNLSLPRRLPDLDGDGIAELVTTCAVTLPSGVSDRKSHVRTNLVLISGRSGDVIGRPYLVEKCTDLASINVTETYEVQFDCTNFDGEPEQYAMSLAELYEKALRKQLPIGSLPSPSDYFRQFYQVQSDSKETVKDSIHLDWIPVRSDCPECGLNARLWDGFGHRPLWNQTWWDAVAFQPLATRFETSRLYSPIEGFVFRLWEWLRPGDTFSSYPRVPQPPPRTTTMKSVAGSTLPVDQDEVDEEDDPYSLANLYRSDNNLMSSDDSDDSSRFRPNNDWISRMNPFSFGNGRRLLSLNLASRVLRVRDSIIYITLNHSSPHVVRLYSRPVLQKCDWQEQHFACTPHFDSQRNSMVIIEDGPAASYRDLIFASQSFVDGNIQTTLKKLRLEKDIALTRSFEKIYPP